MNSVVNSATESRPASLPLKDSIRDMIQLQQEYQLSDELFWEIFNTRVLLNEDVNVDEFVQAMYPSKYGQA